MRVDRDQLDDMLCAAVRAAHDGERVLFEERAHERSIVFHIARHLAARVEALLPGWSVDVDYDRWHRPDIDEVKKRLHWSRVQRANTTRAQGAGLEGAVVRADPGHGAAASTSTRSRTMTCIQTLSFTVDRAQEPKTTCW